ncbi:MAG: D-alanyl-D-alanine carboxypeptidase family protein [Clostridium sp.]|uniref:D-alanyl-D-alanine carboxypeptidase family protein n=1 Tax=Clostridium sp. TaxID=1506 RepID=UPI002FC7764E
MIKKAFKILSLMLVFMLSFFYCVQAKAPVPTNITSDGYVLMDIDSGKVLASKNENTKYEPASITKVLTALIVIEKGNLQDKITTTKNPTLEEGSSLYLKEGEIMTVEQLLHGLMLKSGNDAGTALAEYISGSKEEFAKEMNKRAKEIGAVNSNFSNPHGLNDNNHYTTPKDFALIAREAMKNPTFRKISSTVSYQIAPTPQFAETRFLINHNKLIATQRYKYDGANGIKTGFTKRSLHTFVGSATKGSTSLLVVCLKNGTQCYDDTKLLLDYGFTNYETKTIIKKGDVFAPMTLKGKEDINLIPTEDVTYLDEKSKPATVKTNVKYIDKKSFNVGDVVAKLEVSVNGDTYKTINLTADKEYKTKVDKVFDKLSQPTLSKYIVFLCAGIAVLLAILLLFNIKIKKNRR